jgi:hypothetical protein
MAAAPAPAATALNTQMKAYRSMREDFAKVAPSSAEGKAAAKEATAKDLGNMTRKAY